MNKTLLRASLVAMLSFVACGNDFMNVMASEEVSADVIFDPGAEKPQTVQSIVAEMQNYIRSRHYRDAAKLMSNYVYAKGKSIVALFPSVLEDLKLGNPVGDDAEHHVEELLRELGYLSLNTSFKDIAENELLSIASDNLNDYQTMASEQDYEFTQQRALAAALAGSVKVFEYMVMNSSPIYDSDLFTAALVGGNQELVRLCVQKGADKTWSFNCLRGGGFITEKLFRGLNTQGKELEKEVTNSFLLPVSAGGELSFVKYLVEECHAEVGVNDYFGNTPLLLASEGGHLDVVKYLVEQGKANVEAKNSVDNTPLILASQEGHLDVVKYLVEECHADVEAKSCMGNTPLIGAYLQNHLDVVKYLVEECHADVEAKDNEGRTPLIMASGNRGLDIVKYLVEECHAKVGVNDHFGNTPLIKASQRGNLDIVKYLVEECHADVEAKNDYGFNPLINASQWGRLDIVKYLVEQGYADVEAKDRFGSTPLIWASQEGYLDVVKYLVEQGQANVEAKNDDGETPLMLASQKGYLDIVKYLVEECHANVEAKDKTGKTPLIEASRLGRLDIVKYLVKQCHADVEAKDKDGNTPLFLASRYGYLDIVKSLVEEAGVKIIDKAIYIAKTDEIKKYLKREKGKQDGSEYEYEGDNSESGGIPVDNSEAEIIIVDSSEAEIEQAGAKITDGAISIAGTDEIKEYLKREKDEQDGSEYEYEEENSEYEGDNSESEIITVDSSESEYD